MHSKEKKDAEKENKTEEKKAHEHSEKKFEVKADNKEADKGIEDIKKALELKEKESADYLDKYKRTLADMENLRKRTVLEKQEALKYSNFNIISDLVVLLDDFQRAIDSAKKDEKKDMQTFVDGVDMIEKQFIDLLHKKYGVVKYGDEGEEFDPKIHMALTMEKGDYDKEEILEVFRKGYILFERVIRPAEVKIGTPADEKISGQNDDAGQNNKEEVMDKKKDE